MEKQECVSRSAHALLFFIQIDLLLYWSQPVITAPALAPQVA